MLWEDSSCVSHRSQGTHKSICLEIWKDKAVLKYYEPQLKYSWGQQAKVCLWEKQSWMLAGTGMECWNSTQLLSLTNTGRGRFPIQSSSLTSASYCGLSSHVEVRNPLFVYGWVYVKEVHNSWWRRFLPREVSLQTAHIKYSTGTYPTQICSRDTLGCNLDFQLRSFFN